MNDGEPEHDPEPEQPVTGRQKARAAVSQLHPPGHVKQSFGPGPRRYRRSRRHLSRPARRPSVALCLRYQTLTFNIEVTPSISLHLRAAAEPRRRAAADRSLIRGALSPGRLGGSILITTSLLYHYYVLLHYVLIIITRYYM